MSEEELKKHLDKVYAVGFKNGQIEMKNKVLKLINRDWTIPIEYGIGLLKRIQKIRLSKPEFPTLPTHDEVVN